MDEQNQTPAGAAGPVPGTPPAAPGTPPAADRFFDSIRRSGLVRTEDRWVGGVAGGVARRFGLDPLLVRGLLGVSLLVAGAGLVLYAAGWVLLPEERDGRIHAQELMRGNFDGAVVGAAIMLLAGLTWDGMRVWPFAWFGDWLTGLTWLGAVAAMITLAVVMFAKRETPSPRAGTPASPQTPANPAATQYAGASPYATAGAPAPWPSAAPDDRWNERTAHQGHQVHRPPAEPVRRVHGPGAAVVGAVVGLWALGFAALLLAERVGLVDGPLALIGLGGLLVLAGLGVVVSGIRGRSSGALGTIAVIAALVAVPAAAWQSADVDITGSHRSGFGEATFEPRSVSAAERGYAMVAGDWTLDLTSLPRSTDVVEVPVAMAAGDLTILVPQDSAWDSQIRLMAGAVVVHRAQGPDTSQSGLLSAAGPFQSQAVADGAQATLRLLVTSAAGQITIIEEQS